MANRNTTTPLASAQTPTTTQLLRILEKSENIAFLTEFSSFSGIPIEVLFDEALDDYIRVVLKCRAEDLQEKALESAYETEGRAFLETVERDLSA